jgi:hypothetical protein
LLCNVTSAETDDLAESVAEVFVPALKAKPQASPSSPPSDATAPAAPPTYAASPADLAPIVGAYYDPTTYEIRTVSTKDGAILLGFALDPESRHRALVALDARTLVVKPSDPGDRWPNMTRYAFVPATAGHGARLARTPHDGKATTLERVDPTAPSPAALAAYAGRYTSDEMRLDWSLGVVDGHLVQSRWGRPLKDHALTPIARDAFVSDYASLHFERDTHGKVRGFVFGTSEGDAIHWVRR